MDKLESQYSGLTRRVLLAAESGESSKFKGLFTGRQPEEIRQALTDTSQERFNEVLGNHHQHRHHRHHHPEPPKATGEASSAQLSLSSSVSSLRALTFLLHIFGKKYKVRFTPLIAGAWYGHIDVVEELLQIYGDIVEINQVGYVYIDGRKREVTALCAAIRHRNLEIAQRLIDLGAKVDFCCPLSIACNRGDVHSVKLLIKNKANLDARDDTGITCLMAACERHSFYVVRLLLNNGADARLEDADGNTALHRLALKQRMFVLKNGPLPQIIDALVNAGAQTSLKNQAGQTALDAACDAGNVEVARAVMGLPEVRPEEQLTAQSKLRERLERALEERRNPSETIADGQTSAARKSTYTEKFTNPNEQRKLRKSRSVVDKIADIADKIADLADNMDKDIPEMVNGAELDQS